MSVYMKLVGSCGKMVERAEAYKVVNQLWKQSSLIVRDPATMTTAISCLNACLWICFAVEV